MIQYILIILGALLLLAVIIDMALTIVFLNGAGPVSKRLSRLIWNIFYIVSGKNGESKILTFAGGFILIFVIFAWIFMIWAGYSLIFLSDPNSVVDASTLAPANIVGNIYYVGYTITSLGNGDLKSGSDFWRIISNIMGITSMIFTTVGISYLLPVLQAVIQKRSLSIYIGKLGNSPEEILNTSWNSKDFHGLYALFGNIEEMLLQHSERHLSYPILHYFHSNVKEYSAPLMLAILDEMITIQEVYEIDKQPNIYQWKVLRGVMDNYLNRLDESFIGTEEKLPPFPYTDIPDTQNLSEEVLKEKLAKYQDRRCKLYNLITKDGWDWSDVTRVIDDVNK